MKSPPDGFSLLELLVVISLMATISALTMPNLVGMYQSFSARLDLEAVAGEINGLGYRTFEVGRGAWLVGNENDFRGEPSVAQKENKLELNLPPRWHATVTRPIRYNANGACLGGTISLYHGEELMVSDELKAPYCQLDV